MRATKTVDFIFHTVRIHTALITRLYIYIYIYDYYKEYSFLNENSYQQNSCKYLTKTLLTKCKYKLVNVISTKYKALALIARVGVTPTNKKKKKKKKNLRSYGHWIETSKSANRNLVPSHSTKNHLLSLSELADRK